MTFCSHLPHTQERLGAVSMSIKAIRGLCSAASLGVAVADQGFDARKTLYGILVSLLVAPLMGIERNLDGPPYRLDLGIERHETMIDLANHAPDGGENGRDNQKGQRRETDQDGGLGHNQAAGLAAEAAATAAVDTADVAALTFLMATYPAITAAAGLAPAFVAAAAALRPATA